MKKDIHVLGMINKCIHVNYDSMYRIQNKKS